MTGRNSLPANLGRRSGGVSSGGIQKRRASGRLDKEGDLDMGGQAPTGPRARPISGARVARATRSSTVSGQRPETGPAKGLRPNRNPARAPVGTVKGVKAPTGGFIEMKVSGWKGKANETEAIIFLERKTKEKLRRPKTVGDFIMFQIPLVKVPSILEWDNVAFAGSNLRIQSVSELPASIQAAIKPAADRSEQAQQTAVLLKNVLISRYMVDTKMLDLSSLANDAQLRNSGIFSHESTTSKMFPALMKIADEQFTNRAEKRDQVHSVNLANNTLPDITMVVSLATTFPELKNLSLENNNITTLKQLEAWKYKFRKLEQLILQGNPITQIPGYREEIRKWWKSLVMLDNVPYPDPPVTARANLNAGPGPFPQMPVDILPGVVADVEHTNNFLSTFFPLFDKDRKACLQTFYDETSLFAISVNVSAPRLVGGEKHNLQKWDAYIPKSRNLVRLHNAKAIKDRCARGPVNILKTWDTLPRTLHDVTDPSKWSYDSKEYPFGDTVCLVLSVHGEYEEPENVAREGIASKRSFTRSFIIVPSGRPEGGYLIKRDSLIVRAYGGHHAWNPEMMVQQAAANQPAVVPPGQPLPQGQIDPKQQLIMQLMTQTGLTEQYAQLCLEQTGWELAKAMQAFNEVRASGQLPPDALTSAAIA